VLPVCGAYIWRGLNMEGLIFGILRYFDHCFSLENLNHVVQFRAYTMLF